MRVEWVAREHALPPSAVVGTGAVARELGRRLAALEDAQLGALRAVAGADILLVLGDRHALPWVNGVVYLGRDPHAPGLLLPTTLAPTIASAVLATAVEARANASPVAVLAEPRRLIPCGDARSIERSHLARWLEGSP